jgi:hypothetical protein
MPAAAPPILGAFEGTLGAELRRLLELEPDATDEQVVDAVVRLLGLKDAALGIGFASHFSDAMRKGRVHPAHEDAWRRAYFHDPPATRELMLAQKGDRRRDDPHR